MIQIVEGIIVILMAILLVYIVCKCKDCADKLNGN